MSPPIPTAASPLWIRRVLVLAVVSILAGAASREFLKARRAAELRAQTQRLRAMYFTQNFEGASSEGERLMLRFPESSELKAWTILSWRLTVPGGPDKAIRAAEEMTTRRPVDPWGWFALAGAGSDKALAASEKALAMMPRHPDILWMRARCLLTSMDRAGEVPAFVDAHRKEVSNPAELLVVKAQALEFLGTEIRRDDSKVAEAYATMDEARRIDSTNFHANYLPGIYLYRGGEPERGLPLVKRALSLAPDSTWAHLEYWRAFNALAPREQASERASVVADLESLEARSGSRPWTLLKIADQYGELNMKVKQMALEERILKGQPDESISRLILSGRTRRLAQAIDLRGVRRHEGPGKPPESPLVPGEMESLDVLLRRELTDSLKQSLWDYVSRHDDEKDWFLQDAYSLLFLAMKDDPDVDGEKLLKVVRGLADHPRGAENTDVASGAIALAERGMALEEAEAVTRKRLSALEAAFVRMKGELQNEANYNAWRREATAEMHDALGWILFKQRRLTEAEKELSTAHRLDPEKTLNLYHLGKLAEAQEDWRRAQRRYAEGSVLPPRDGNFCVDALRDLYEKTHGSLSGYEAHLSAQKVQGRASRKERLLGERIQRMESIPAFRLKSLTGGFVSSDDLKGKVAVLSFSGVWCHACQEEMPYFQELADAYAQDPQVAIHMVDAYDPQPLIRKWMRDKAYTFPVLLDDGFVSDHVSRIEAFPTTWFLDPQGRIAYILRGGDENLVEEFGSIIEDLRRR